MKPLKNAALLGILISTSLGGHSQVMISQYTEAESGSNPKGIEVYNYTDTSINFSITPLKIFQGDDGTSCTSKLTINSGILEPNKVWVIGTSDLTDYASKSNDIGGVTTYWINFNGNDALELYLDNELMDVFGTCGSDPGIGWTENGVSTANQNIAIKSEICSGTISGWSDPSVRFEKIAKGSILDGFGVSPSCISNTISTSFGSAPIEVDCNTASSKTVSFTSTGTFEPGNIFRVELSNKDGYFFNYTTIGSVSLSGTDLFDDIDISIPENTYTGSGYRVRVMSDNPPTNGTNNDNNLFITNTEPCLSTIPSLGGLFINEFSNGSGLHKEYYELLVVGECGEKIDISGYILDDNNGEFGVEGLSSGHLTFKNHPQWNNIPVGSIIVIYYENDKNPSIPQDDLYDSNNDSVYIIPHKNNDLIEIFSDFPNKNNSSYSESSLTTVGWNTTIGLNNTNDAAQTRKPNGDYFFGIAYGKNMNGGPDNTLLTKFSMVEKNAFFNSGDFKNISNWSTGVAPTDETPGAANNQANKEWIEMLRNKDGSPCGLVPLPILLTEFSGVYENGKTNLSWKSKTELNNAYYEIFHSKTGKEFTSIGKIEGLGTSSIEKDYHFSHRVLESGVHYYQLKSIDFDGKTYPKGIISVQVNRDYIVYDKTTQSLHFPSKGNYSLYTISGQKIIDSKNKNQVHFDQQGVYLIQNHKNGLFTKIAIP